MGGVWAWAVGVGGSARSAKGGRGAGRACVCAMCHVRHMSYFLIAACGLVIPGVFIHGLIISCVYQKFAACGAVSISISILSIQEEVA
jgi:hypothetical protein